MQFSKAYNRKEFINFLRDSFLPDDFLPTEIQVTLFTQTKYTSSVTKLGTCESLDLVVYEIRHRSRNDARVGLSKEAFRILADEFQDRALVLFVPEESPNNYRFSLITVDIDISVEGQLSRRYSNPRRYSYYLGNGIATHTPDQFLIQKGRVVNEDDLKNRFSVEVLTKAFYNELFDWYQWAVNDETGVFFPSSSAAENEAREQNDTKIIRLITRLMFVWFIKQKDLVPSMLFDAKQIKKVIKDFNPLSKTSGNYYNAILQNLFFATLNRAIVDEDGQRRCFEKTDNKEVKTTYRYADLFTISEEEVIKMFADIPFLNGGLFECLDKTKKIDGLKCTYNYDGFDSDNSKLANGRYRNRAFVPNILFFDSEYGLFSILNRYNFTIEENTPNEQQVALDPELLGKVFENLLGAYNPETKETARNQSGSFYTPREVVNYMVDESLIAYLGDTPLVRTLLSDDFEYESDKTAQYQSLATKLKTIKILDPACGSGAFPMGLLNRIVDILQKISPEESLYKLKLNLIENCIYGIDIQSIAVQISKLRFFISLICDCEKDASKPNFGIPTLPNLETKFVCANSLISADIIKYAGDWTNNPDLNSMQKELIEIRQKHFGAHTTAEKRTYRAADEKKRDEILKLILANVTEPDHDLITKWKIEIEKLREEAIIYKDAVWIDVSKEPEVTLFGTVASPNSIIREDINKKKRDEINSKIRFLQLQIDKELNKGKLQGFEAAVKQITDWNPYDQNASSEFFSAEWMFNVKDGFDIVIGNPPYVSTKGVKEADKKKYEAEFGFSDDTYNLFTFKGLSLTKPGGSLSYIIPKTFWTTGTKRGMRDLILGKKIRYVFDTANPFEAVMVDTCIIQVLNEDFSGSNKVHFFDGSKDFRNPIVFEPIEQKIYLNTQNSVIFKPSSYNLHIWELYGEKVKDLYNQWWDKIETSKKISQNAEALKKYREKLRPGDIALLGCLTEGGQGLATANNGKYIAVRKSTKWAGNILESRPKKLIDAVVRFKITPNELKGMSPTEFLATSTEQEIADTFDRLKEKYGRDIFGQGYIYKLIDDSELADVDSLTDDEKENGIDTSKRYYVPYDKGDKDGNRWYLETPFAIAWSKENVHYLKTNSGKKGAGMPVVRNPQFNFKEGFCWNNVLNPQARLLKAKMKTASVNDVGSMSLSTTSVEIPNYYFVSILNSNLIFNYYRTFINCSVNIQINDIRMLPVIVPTKEALLYLEPLFQRVVEIKKESYTTPFSCAKNEEELGEIERTIDEYVDILYSINTSDQSLNRSFYTRY